MSGPRRVLLMSNLYPPHVIGGAELVAQALARGLRERGLEVGVVATCGPECGPGLHRDDDDGIPVWRFFPRNSYWPYVTRERPLLRKLAWHARDAYNAHAAQVLGRLVDDLRPELVHTHNIDGFSPAAWRVPARRGLPVVHTAHDFHLVCPRAKLLRSTGALCADAPWPCLAWRRWYARAAQDVDLFCAPSRFVLKEHARWGVVPRSAQVVRNGVPRIRDALPGRAPGPLRALYLGQLEPHKGVRVLLDALRMLPRSVALRVDVAGRGSLERHLQAHAADDARLRLHGFVEGVRKAALLAQADLMLVPSLWYENAPLSALEALANGLVVVASDLGGLPELVQPGRNGFLVTPGDPGALAAVLQALAAFPGKVQALRQRSLDSLQTLTVDAMVDGYLAAYAQVVSNRRQ